MVFNMDSVTFFLTYSYIYVELDCLFNISTIIVLHESLHTRTKVFVSKRKSIWTTIRAIENFCFSIVFNSSPALDRCLPFWVQSPWSRNCQTRSVGKVQVLTKLSHFFVFFKNLIASKFLLKVANRKG